MLRNKFIIGIDPGRNGGIVGLTNGKINIIDKMPQQTTDLWGYFIDGLGIPMIHEWDRKENVHVFIENIHSMPTDGVKSAFSFGYHLGQLDMCLARWDLHTERIVPRVWQEWFGLSRRKSETEPESKYQYKKRILEKAKSLVPRDKEKELDLTTCDAYLIALYGFNQLKKRESDDQKNS